jgi:hypothetical protein
MHAMVTSRQLCSLNLDVLFLEVSLRYTQVMLSMKPLVAAASRGLQAVRGLSR